MRSTRINREGSGCACGASSVGAPGARDPGLDLFQLAGKVGRQEAPLAVGQHEYLVFDPNAERPLGKIDARLDREHRARRQRRLVRAGVVDVETHEMAEEVDELVEV